MPKSNRFSGRISYIILLIAGIIISFGTVSFFTTHETLKQNSSANNLFHANYLDENEITKKLPVKILILSVQKGEDGSVIRYVNNDLHPTISIRPGEIQRWKLFNSSNDFFKIAIPGISFYVVARDGNVTTIPITSSDEVLAPKDSLEIFIQGPGWGSYEIVSEDLTTNDSQEFMTLKSESFPVFNSHTPETLVPNYDLRNAKIEKTQDFILEKRGEDFYVNGVKTENDIIVEDVEEGFVEQWNLRNTSDKFTSFTVPNNIFQVVQINGNPIERFGYDHTFVISPKGSVTIRVK